jgi:hypothetical protein
VGIPSSGLSVASLTTSQRAVISESHQEEVSEANDDRQEIEEEEEEIEGEQEEEKVDISEAQLEDGTV